LNVKRVGGRYEMRGTKNKKGSALVLVVLSLIILSTLGLGMLSAAYGVRHKAIKLKNEAVAMLAAEAGYEKAVFWMSQQQDLLSSLAEGREGTSGALSFEDGSCEYGIEFYSFVGSRPVYKIVSDGSSGAFNRTVEVLMVQAISGWDMGMCRVPLDSRNTCPVYFANGEVIDMPLHINDLKDNPDNRDIHLFGDPEFMQATAMGESRNTDGGGDKYSDVMDSFDNGIYFDQPDSKITDEDSIQSKVDRFSDSTAVQYKFTPEATAPVPKSNAAVQLEFFVEGGVGKVRITNDCTVPGYQRNSDYKTYDYELNPDQSEVTEFRRYDIYSYHYMPEDAEANGQRFAVPIEDTYVTQSFGGEESAPGGQIFIDGDVIIGGDMDMHNGDQLVKGNVTVVATGNIWIADSIQVDGAHQDDGTPDVENPNILGLISQGVIKVVDPGMSEYTKGGINQYPGPPAEVPNAEYVPIGRQDPGEEAEEYQRHLPDQMIVEAAMTVGGGGWGAENVRRGSYGGRKEDGGNQDSLILHGTITEAIRGVVGLIGGDGYLKHYYFDGRVCEGILPGDIWLRGKFVPAPAGWSDYRTCK
ncbi:MAG: hypothetical protein JSW47_13995, partial [Phycisphaerales bacterium]